MGGESESRPAGEPPEEPFLPPSLPDRSVPRPPASPPPPELPPDADAQPLRQLPGEPPAPVLPPSVPTPPPPPPADPSLPPAAAPAASPGQATSGFDARAMVESQKRHNPNPAYGDLPTGTAASREAAARLRRDANRRRRRRKLIGRIVALLVLAGLAVAGWFAYQSFQDDRDDPVPSAGSTESGAPSSGDSGALTPLGEQQQVVEGLDDVNSGATQSAGGLLGAVDQARDLVAGANGGPSGTAAALPVTALLSPSVLAHADRLDPVDGFERYLVHGAELAESDPAAGQELIDLLLAAPQVAAGDPRLALLPEVAAADVAIAIRRDGDVLVEFRATSTEPAIRTVWS